MRADLGEASYDVVVESGVLERFFADMAENFNVLVIMDSELKDIVEHNCPSIKKIKNENIFLLPARKESKNLYSLLSIFEKLELLNFPRSGTIVALGGGVIGDVAGLAASLWYRGCNLIHVPTTLLASVDSCLGGKTAINFNKTINAIGSYYHPEKILIDTGLIKHLPDREISSGMAEVIKCSIIGNPELSALLRDIEFKEILSDPIIKNIVKLSLKQKEKFVMGDIREDNKRLFLNLGHTIGHALEINTIIDGIEMLRHGEGVSLGIVAIANISNKLGMLERAGLEDIMGMLKKFKLPTSIDLSNVPIEKTEFISECVKATFRDKKRKQHSLRLILPINKGTECKIYETNDEDLIRFGIISVIGDRK